MLETVSKSVRQNIRQSHTLAIHTGQTENLFLWSLLKIGFLILKIICKSPKMWKTLLNMNITEFLLSSKIKIVILSNTIRAYHYTFQKQISFPRKSKFHQNHITWNIFTKSHSTRYELLVALKAGFGELIYLIRYYETYKSVAGRLRLLRA